jgi:hypothetical protein
MTGSENVNELATALAKAQGNGEVEGRLFYRHLRTWELGGRQHQRVPLVFRLLNRVVFGMSDCWHFCGSRNQFGYGRLTFKGRMQVVHRLSYETFVGPIPAGMSVLHRCDSPSCINPEHLWLGTYAENSRDCWEKGRHPLKTWVMERRAKRENVQ